MMGTGHKLGEPVEEGSGSGLRRVRRWRVLLAHDAVASTCDLLLETIEGALGNVEITESSSVEDARVAAHTGHPDIAMICLDLPPAPVGGVRLAEELVKRGQPVILVTRSLRWIPPTAVALREVAWIPPDADVDDVARAVREVYQALRGGPPLARREESIVALRAASGDGID
jgi:DNA-binding NarL/FixJ family response regulator